MSGQVYFYHLAAYLFRKGNQMDKYDVEYRMRAIKDTCDIFDELLSYDTGDDYWKRCVCEASILYLEQDMYDEETQQRPEEISLCQAQIDVITYRLKPYKGVKPNVIKIGRASCRERV